MALSPVVTPRCTSNPATARIRLREIVYTGIPGSTTGTMRRVHPGITSTAYQSRLGPASWIRPYTDVVLRELAEQGHRRVAVLCPGFVADCLETLEEIGIRAVAQWQSLGGEALRLVPSLNAHPVWVDGLARMLRQRA